MPKYLGSWSIAVIALSFVSGHAFAQEGSRIGSAALLEAEHEVSARLKSQSWQPGVPVLPLSVGDSVRTGLLSRATVRLTDLSVLRMNEATTIQVLSAAKLGSTEGVDIKNGAIYFFSRDRPREMRIQTPVATGALRGTEFHVAVGANGRTTVTMLDGEVQLSNAHGSVLIRTGEQGEVVRGQAPRKTAVIQTINIIQWCLYYPGVIDIDELKLSAGTQRRLSTSLLAYRQGDVLGALRAYPMDRAARSESEQLYRAAVLLTVGQVDKAKAQLRGVTSNSSTRRAIETLIAAVTYQPAEGDENQSAPGVSNGQQEGDFKSTANKNVIDSGSAVFGNSNGLNDPQTASEWLAQSYYEQAHGHLERALVAAKQATVLSPSFGFAWTRVAELEFSFGRTPNAARALEKGVAIAPLNAASFALRGFVLSAQNYIGQAIESFERSMTLDGALGDAWLGRGLCLIRRGHDVEGRKDIQTAAVLEPTRSLFRSYLGKAFSNVGSVPAAQLELKRAVELDPKDPTPWLYSAIERKQENRYNEAIDDLEKSVELNDNRRLYRSQFLLDQDRSIRGTNLAAIYQEDGMVEQSVREAVRAVDSDYSSAPAHLFLANSYNALRDPDRILLRYETAWFNELLLSNLLSPVGGGPLSQFVSEQEYSKMFEHDGLGVSSVTDYFSYGEVRETASQYGTFGNVSYAVDTQYQYASGIRPNNWIERSETYAQLKIQLDPQDTVFFQTKFEDLKNGDVLQHYNQSSIDKSLDFHEKQDPALLLLGFHHEWAPGIHTLILVGRLENEQTLTSQNASRTVVAHDVSPFVTGLAQALGITPADFNDPFGNPVIFRTLRPLTGRGEIESTANFPFALDYQPKFEAYTAELQQIATIGPDTIVLGGRYQSGQFNTRDRLTSLTADPFISSAFDKPAADQLFIVNLERVSLYLYNTWSIASWLSVTGGITYDHLDYPDNFRSVPVNDRQSELEKVSPKVGFILQPWRGTVLRGSYTEAISGASFDESIRLEPTQVAGFTQAYRTLASESLIGSVAGSRYHFWGMSAEQKLPTRTYLGVEFNVLKQKVDRTVGVFDFLDSLDFPTEILPSSLAAKDNYREEILTATANQLVGEKWSLGINYRYTISKFREQFPALEGAARIATGPAGRALSQASESAQESRLHTLDLFALYNHPCGFFARCDADWYKQNNDGLAGAPLNEPGDAFWQLNLMAGWRFYKNQCELSCGVLNMTGTDYRLDPLNPYVELPRSQTFVLRAKLSF